MDIVKEKVTVTNFGDNADGIKQVLRDMQFAIVENKHGVVSAHKMVTQLILAGRADEITNKLRAVCSGLKVKYDKTTNLD